MMTTPKKNNNSSSNGDASQHDMSKDDIYIPNDTSPGFFDWYSGKDDDFPIDVKGSDIISDDNTTNNNN